MSKLEQGVPASLIDSIAQTIEQARGQVRSAVNQAMVMSYWQVGRLIVEHEQQGQQRAEYGKKQLQQLSQQLTQRLGKGFDVGNLRNMRQFYLTFPIRDAVRSELSWTHYRTLMRVENAAARDWYLQEAIQQHWSARALERQITKLYYERLLASKDRALVEAEAKTHTQPLADSVKDYLRDPYILDFLNLQDKTYQESQLEQGIINNLQQFLLELGKGFAFVERQQRIRFSDEDFYIDLVFYNFKLKCFLLVDLKLGKLKHQDVGQMDTYVRLYDQKIKGDDDNPTIGLVLCSEKSEAKLLEDIPNKVRDVLGIVVDVNLLERDGIEVIEIRVEPYPYPISYKGEYHYRTGSTKQELKGAALDRFLLRKQGLHWDGVPLPGLNEAELDKSVLKQFRQLSVKSQRLPEQVLEDADPVLLERLRLVNGDYLKRAAALLFHPDPERYVTGAFLKVGYFEHDHADLRYQDEIHGDLFKQVAQVLEVLKLKYLKAVISYDGLYREESYPMPIPALREALLNAVVHKDYASSIPIQISVYPDQLMIWNPGVLPDNWTLDDLTGKHASRPFNPDIANAFFRAGLIESWGRGIERIVHACQEDGYPVPEWKLETGGLWAVFHYPESYKVQVSGLTGQETAQETTQEKIIHLLKADPTLTRNQLAMKLGITSDGVKYHLEKLKRAGKLKRTGSTKVGIWEVIE